MIRFRYWGSEAEGGYVGCFGRGFLGWFAGFIGWAKEEGWIVWPPCGVAEWKRIGGYFKGLGGIGEVEETQQGIVGQNSWFDEGTGRFEEEG